MVKQNYIVYVNKNKNLRTAPLSIISPDGQTVNLSFKIPEKHLICGLIIEGECLKGRDIRGFPFKPIEKYLFEFSNIHFFVLDHEYSEENKEYNWLGSENRQFRGFFDAEDYYDDTSAPPIAWIIVREGAPELKLFVLSNVTDNQLINCYMNVNGDKRLVKQFYYNPTFNPQTSDTPTHVLDFSSESQEILDLFDVLDTSNYSFELNS